MPNPIKPHNRCKECNKYIRAQKLQLCRACYNKKRIKDGLSKRIDSQISTASRHRNQNVRTHAKRVMSMSGISKSCSVCGYDKHVEVCHIKSISSFDSSTTLEVVNTLSNLMYLCPNHHWELDNEST